MPDDVVSYLRPNFLRDNACAPTPGAINLGQVWVRAVELDGIERLLAFMIGARVGEWTPQAVVPIRLALYEIIHDHLSLLETASENAPEAIDTEEGRRLVSELDGVERLLAFMIDASSDDLTPDVLLPIRLAVAAIARRMHRLAGDAP